MTFEARLADAFGRYADQAPVDVDEILVRSAIASGRRRGFAALPWASGRRAAAWAVFALLVLAALAAALVVGSLINRHARLPGGFSEAGPSDINYIVTAAALRDGRVLVLGDNGYASDGSSIPAPVEIFDPASKSFRRTGDLASPRYGLTATALRDGRVLVAGGAWTAPGSGDTSVATAELYDPTTGSFTRTGDMTARRSNHTAVLLADGRVLVIGGQTTTNGEGGSLFSAEVYDPGSGRWSAAGSLNERRALFTTTVLRDGRVLVAFGWDEEGNDLASAEVFDPAANTFTAVSPPAMAARSPASALLPDGRVLFVGGYLGNSPSGSTILFDPAADVWTDGPNLKTERYGPATISLQDGRVLIAGGGNLLGGALSTEIYDPATGVLIAGASAAHEHGVPGILLPDGRVVLFDANTEIYDPRATTEVPGPASRADRIFVEAAGPPTDRTAHTATKLADGRVMLAGGLASRGVRGGAYSALGTVDIYDPKAGTSVATGSLLTTPQQEDVTGKLGNTALLLDDGRVLMVVVKSRHHLGSGPAPGPEWDLQTWDPATGRFTLEGSVESTNDVQGPIRAVQLSDGRLLIVGPPISAPPAPNRDAAVYQVDRPTIAATRLGELTDCGDVIEALVAPGDRIVVLCRTADQAASVRVFDPRTGSSSRIEVPMEAGAAAMVGLADGRVVVAGGSERTLLTLVDPATGGATPAGVVQTASHRSGAFPATAGLSMTVFAGDRVLIVSGDHAGVWDPKTAGVTPIAGPTASREGHTATLLDDGRILVFGGTYWPADNGAPSPPAGEIFDPSALP